MDYKFSFYPWYIDETYELVDDFPITQETCDYFATLKTNEYIQKHFPRFIRILVTYLSVLRDME